MVNTVLQMLKEHPKYHKNIKDAAESQKPIILNYHIHPGESKYCVSILSKPVKHLDMEDEKSTSEELAHIKGISDLEELFVPFTYGGGINSVEIMKQIIKAVPIVAKEVFKLGCIMVSE